jgi:hypothetical protein
MPTQESFTGTDRSRPRKLVVDVAQLVAASTLSIRRWRIEWRSPVRQDAERRMLQGRIEAVRENLWWM